MLRISKLADYGIVVLTHMARDPERIHNATEIAERTDVAAPTVSKLLKLLARAGILVSYRGANGGYRLARPPEALSMAEIIDAVEGPVGLTECSSEAGRCAQEPVCSVRGNWQRINQAVRLALSHVTLAEMTRPMAQAPAPTLCHCGQHGRGEQRLHPRASNGIG